MRGTSAGRFGQRAIVAALVVAGTMAGIGGVASAAEEEKDRKVVVDVEKHIDVELGKKVDVDADADVKVDLGRLVRATVKLGL